MSNDDIHNRVVRVVIPEETVQPLFTGELAVADCVPEDATFVRAFEQADSRLYNFVFRHESFDPVPEGEVIPTVEFNHQTITEASE